MTITNLRNTRKPQSQVFLFLVFNYSSVTREFLKHNGNATQIEWEKKDGAISQDIYILVKYCRKFWQGRCNSNGAKFQGINKHIHLTEPESGRQLHQ